MLNKENEEALKIKIILVGNARTGKTSIINRYYSNTFTLNTLMTVSMNYVSKKLKINNKNIVANIWDTAGQEQYRSVNQLFIKDSDIVIFVYDITDKQSFEDLDYWHKFIIEELGENPLFGLVGNKVDLYDNEEVTDEEGEELAKKWEAFFALLSAKEDNNSVHKFFEDVIKLYLENNPDLIDNLKRKSTITLKQYKENKIEDNALCCSSGKKAKKEKNLKMIFLGEKGVGKTYIVERILGREISKKYEHTTKIIKYNTKYKYENNKTINIHIIDTNGDSISSNRDLKDYVKHGKIYFLVFDVYNEDSLYKLINFVEDIKKYHKKKTTLLFVLGNKKKTSKDNNNCLKTEEAEQFARQIGAHYEMVSSEDGDFFSSFISIYAEKYLKKNK